MTSLSSNLSTYVDSPVSSHTFGVKASRFFASGSQSAGLGVFQRAANFLPLPSSNVQHPTSNDELADDATDGISAQGSIHFWVIGAMGFRQSAGDQSGLELLWGKMRVLSEPGVCIVKPYEWDADAEKEAAFVARNSAPGAVVLMYTYSYGTGNFFAKFSRALQRYGIRIARLISCDGIRRWLVVKPLSSRWFQDLVSIEVPSNVDMAYRFWQDEDGLLRGHRLVAEDAEATEIIDWQLHDCDHCSIDENLSFHAVALQEFRNVITGTEAPL